MTTPQELNELAVWIDDIVGSYPFQSQDADRMTLAARQLRHMAQLRAENAEARGNVEKALRELGDMVKQRDRLRADLHEAAELLRDAQMYIEAENIDWSRFNEGPDRDPDYKPVFPEIVQRCDSFLAKLKALGLL